MKRLVLLLLSAVGLSGCVADEPYGRYRPYPVAGPVIIDDDRGYDRYERYDRPPVYRPAPVRYDRPYRDRYDRGRYDRDDRYERYDRPVRVGRGYDGPRRYDNRPPVVAGPGPVRGRPGRPLPPQPGPGPVAAPEVVRTDLPDQPRYRQLQRERAARAGPQPYIPPVPLD